MKLKLCSGMVVLLLVAVVGLVWKFMFQGSTTIASDRRQAIELTESERDLVLGEMRAFLVSVQQINQELAEGDMERVVAAARKSGRAAQQAVPGSLMGKLPMEFKQLGFDTHAKFDQLALDAEQMGDQQQTLVQLANLMKNCVSCHASYRFPATIAQQ